MTDELTPEERKALDRLPRERMPAGLEERVVGAMREHGFLAGRRPTIVLSNARVAGLLAACIALVIGGYSLGLHRGDGDRVLPAVQAPKPVESGRADRPAALAREEKAEPGALGETSQAKEPATEQPRQNAPVEADETIQKEAATRESEVARSMPAETPAKTTVETPAPAAALNESAAGMPAPQGKIAPGFTQFPLRLLFNGTPVIIEAPESVRVVQDERDRMLIIHTSDGIIRIRAADND